LLGKQLISSLEIEWVSIGCMGDIVKGVKGERMEKQEE
jgi:hypothetical protein